MATKAEERLLNLLVSHDGFNEGSLWKVRIDVVEAMIEALTKHGRPTLDPNRGLVTILEELGEASECALNATRPVLTMSDDPKSTETVIEHLRDMNRELAQVAGYTMLLMMSMRSLYHNLEEITRGLKATGAGGVNNG